jgi:predicted naringenin-chalcone synthase
VLATARFKAYPRRMIPVFLHDFFNIKPRHQVAQTELNAWLTTAHQRVVELTGTGATDLADHLRYMIADSAIQQRYTELGEINSQWNDHEIYRLTSETPRGATIEKRGQVFQKRAQEVFQEFYAKRLAPNHLLHVTCTGYISPSAPQVYFATQDTAPAITHAYHMGCYASMPAIRLAQSLVSSGTASVDVAHTEMCSLHMDAATHTAEQLIVQSLFADGHIVYRASAQQPQGESLRIIMVKEKLLPDSKQDMTWVTAQFGMQMSLSKDVPTKIALALSDFIEEVCTELNLDWQHLQANSDFAIHPGGPKILTLAQELLMLNDGQVQASQEILRERGNMSSATLPHIWQRLLEQPSDKKYVLSLAFGPGLTIFGAVFERTSL